APSPTCPAVCCSPALALAPALARVRSSRSTLPLAEVRRHLRNTPRVHYVPHAQPPLARDRHAVVHVVETFHVVRVRVDRRAHAPPARRAPPSPIQVQPCGV